MKHVRAIPLMIFLFDRRKPPRGVGLAETWSELEETSPSSSPSVIISTNDEVLCDEQGMEEETRGNGREGAGVKG